MPAFLRSGLILGLLGLAGTAIAEPPRPAKAPPLDGKDLARAQEASRELARAVEHLQSDIAQELGGIQDRAFYHVVDPILQNILRFQADLKPGAPRAQLYSTFNRMDAGLQELMKSLQAQGPTIRVFQRASPRISLAEANLYVALSRGDQSERQTSRVVPRQVQALAIRTAELYRTAEFSIPLKQPNRATIEGDLMRLNGAAQGMLKSVGNAYDAERLRKAYAVVNQEWERATQSVKTLQPDQNAYLLDQAHHVDRLLEELHQRLGITTQRTQLAGRP